MKYWQSLLSLNKVLFSLCPSCICSKKIRFSFTEKFRSEKFTELLVMGAGDEYVRFSIWFDRLLIGNFVHVRWSEIWVTDSKQKAAAWAEPFILFPDINIQFCKTSSNASSLDLCKYRSTLPISYQAWIAFLPILPILFGLLVFLFLPTSMGIVRYMQNLYIFLVTAQFEDSQCSFEHCLQHHLVLLSLPSNLSSLWLHFLWILLCNLFL